MPRGDRTGPAGFGPMTGRGLGYCAGYPVPGYMHGGWGRGFGRGFGWGRGRGWGRGWGGGYWGYGAPAAGYETGYAAPFRSFPSQGEVKADLEAYRDELKRELDGVEETLAGKGKKD